MQIYKDLSNQLNPNCFDYQRLPIIVAVCHNTAGPLDNNPGSQSLSDVAANYLTSNDRQVSIHWLIGAEGCNAPIYRIVPENCVAYHCGGTPPNYPSHWIDPLGNSHGRYELNQVSIGIEVFGQPNDVIGPNQLASLKTLVLDIVSRYPILKDPKRWVAHAELEGDRTDGRNWVNLARQWIGEMNNNGNGGGAVQASNLPYGAFINSNGLLQFPNGATIGYGFKDFFLTLGGNCSQDNLAQAVQRGVFMFGLPLESEQKVLDANNNQIGATQKFENCTFKYDASLPAPWNIRLKQL